MATMLLHSFTISTKELLYSLLCEEYKGSDAHSALRKSFSVFVAWNVVSLTCYHRST